MKSESPTADAVELLLLIVLVVLEAAAVLLLALVVLVLAVALPRRNQRFWQFVRTSGCAARSLPPAPELHPLALVAEELAALPVAVLRPMAGTRSKRVRKAELVALVAAC